MNPTNAAYWIAVIAFAFALGSEYHRGGLQPIHRVANEASFAMCHMVTSAERTMVWARNIPAMRTAPEFSAETREMARLKADMFREQALEQAAAAQEQVRAQAEAIRTQVEVTRTEFERMREARRAEIRNTLFTRDVVIKEMKSCPKVHVVIANVPGAGDDGGDSY